MLDNYNLLEFNKSPSTIMHIDLNSCFASVEQQANPHLRGIPIAVAAYNSPGGCILAPSIEAKEYGIKTGMRVRDAKLLHPKLFVMTGDPNKYRHVHLAFRKILADYTNDFSPKSIDEFVLNLDGYPSLAASNMAQIGKEIKKRIRQEIGDWLTVSVGIAPNRLLAKTASGLNKPDGLDEINHKNYLDIYPTLGLTDLCGINIRNKARLNSVGIYSVTDFYQSDVVRLKAAFSSILGYYWYLRLRGWEADAVEFARRSYGNSYAIPNHSGKKEDLLPILYNLVEKTGSRLRHANYKARGIRISLRFTQGEYWAHGETTNQAIFDTRDIYKQAKRILLKCPVETKVHTLAESCFNLVRENVIQLDAFENIEKKTSVVSAIDAVNEKWGTEAVTYGSILKTQKRVVDRIAFGGVKELVLN